MRTKQCSKCGKTKPVEDFTRDRTKKDGRRSQCKECYRQYATSTQGKAALHRANHRYFATAKGKATRRRYNNDTRPKATTENRARYLTRLEVLAGRMPHPTSCACTECGQPAQEYHHPDYTRPYDVIPLCQSCHVKAHGGEMTK